MRRVFGAMPVQMRIIGILAVFGLLSCFDVTGPSHARSLRTDATRYMLTRVSGGYRTRIIATYRNASHLPVFMEGCGPGPARPIYWFQRPRADSELPLYSSMGWACVGGIPGAPIMPGTVREDTLFFSSSDDFQARPRPQAEWRIGRAQVCYALVNTAKPEPGPGARLPESQRCSNEFVLEYSPAD